MKGIKETIPDKNPLKKVRNPWSFDAPKYDERSSCFVRAGNDHGVGYRQPVGHSDNPRSEGVPTGRPNTLRVDE